MSLQIGDLVTPDINILKERYGTHYCGMIKNLTIQTDLPWKVVELIRERERIYCKVLVDKNPLRHLQNLTLSFYSDELIPFHQPQEKLE